MLKGLAEMHRPDGPAPRLTLALFDAAGEAELLRVYNKMSGVCEQFLGWHLEPEPMVRKTFRVAEHLALYCRPTRDKAQLANAPQWGIVADYLARTRSSMEKSAESEAPAPVKEMLPGPAETAAPPAARAEPASRELVADVVIPTAAAAEPARAEPAAEIKKAAEAPAMVITEPPAAPTVVAPAPSVPAAAPPPPPPAPTKGVTDVLDLFGSDATPESILGAVLGQNAASYVECPVRAPMCGEVRLAVGRDRGVVLFAVAQQGLGDLQAIGQAYRWLVENRALIGMAMPQFAIDAHQAPRLRLLVDESDVSAAALQPMLQTGHVTVQSYRKLRWGGRTGLLLDAA